MVRVVAGVPQQIHRCPTQLRGAFGDHISHLLETPAVDGHEAEAGPQRAGFGDAGIGQQFRKRLWSNVFRRGLRHRPVCGIPAAQELDPLVWQSVVQCAADDAVQIARARSACLNAVIDVDPRRRRAIHGSNRQSVATVTLGNAFGAIEVCQIVIGQCPQHPVDRAPDERLQGRDSTLVDQPIVVGQHRRARVCRTRAAVRHLLRAQVGPVSEVGVPLHQESVR